MWAETLLIQHWSDYDCCLVTNCLWWSWTFKGKLTQKKSSFGWFWQNADNSFDWALFFVLSPPPQIVSPIPTALCQSWRKVWTHYQSAKGQIFLFCFCFPKAIPIIWVVLSQNAATVSVQKGNMQNAGAEGQIKLLPNSPIGDTHSLHKTCGKQWYNMWDRWSSPLPGSKNSLDLTAALYKCLSFLISNTEIALRQNLLLPVQTGATIDPQLF